MLTISEIQLFQLLKHKIGDKEAEALVNYVDEKITEKNEIFFQSLVTKEDLSSTKEDLIKSEGRLSSMIASTNEDIIKSESRLSSMIASTNEDIIKSESRLSSMIASTKEDLVKTESRLETKIAETKSDIIRWVFSIFIVTILAIIGLYFKK
jgi:DNA primase catalytic subunit